MAVDILPYAGSAVSLVALLDLLLLLLTHKQSTIRRSAYALLLLALYLSTTTLLAVHSYSHRPPRDVTATELKDAISWIPTSSTPAQEAELGRLRTLVESTHSAFDPLPFTPGELKQDPSRSVTAVVLHWKRRKGLQLVLKHISRYPYIREIIIWNNQGGADLLPTDFILDAPPNSTLGPPSLRIYNSPSNVHDAGKHFACTLATYSHCYFNDDDWLNIYMDASYFKYLDCCADSGKGGRSGTEGGIVSNTLPIIHLEHRRWRFSNPDIDLHTGFTWLGTGSFAPREFSIRFLNQQSAAPVLLRQEQTLVSDMFFSLWTNSYPEQMPNDLVPIDVDGAEVGWSRGAGVDQWAVVYGNILDALRKLHDILAISSPSLVPHPFPSRSPSPESHLRAPCHNDRCLFSTSLTPFPHPSTLVHPSLPLARSFLSRIIPFVKIPASLIITDGRLDPWRIGSVKEVEKRWNEIEGGWPEDKWWIEKGSWHLAVDGKRETCWESWRAPEMDAYFGLTFIIPRSLSKITLVGSNDLANIVGWEATGSNPQAWEILTLSTANEGWVSRRPKKSPLITRTGDEIKVSLELASLLDAKGKESEIRKIKFVSTGRKQERLKVCTIELDSVELL